MENKETGKKLVISLICLVFVGCTANPTQEESTSSTIELNKQNDKVQLEPNVDKNENTTQESHANADSYNVKKPEPAPILAPTRRKQRSLEYQLATIDKGYVSDNDLTITRFRSLLDQLSNKYVENKQSIADMTVATQKLLKEKYGISESLLRIMEGMNRILYQRIPNQAYAEYTTVYIQLRNSGMSHSEAVEGLAALIQTLSGG